MTTLNDYIALENDNRRLREALEICKGSLEACMAMHPDNRGIKFAFERACDTLNQQDARK